MIDKLKIDKKQLNFDWEGKKIWFENGLLAPQAEGSMLISFEWIRFLTACTINKNPDEWKNFLPLMVNFREMFYSAGKIWWAPYTRKEWRPSDNSVLTSRIVDRCLRPMFPEWMINDIVLTINTLQIDKKNNYQVPAIISASLSLLMAWVEFEGPVWAVSIWYKDSKFIINPTKEEDMMNLVVAWTKDTITMIELDWEDVDTDILIKAIDIAQKQLKYICEKQEEFLKQFNIEKITPTINKPDNSILKKVQQMVNKYENDFFPTNKKRFWEIYDKIKDEVKEKYQTEENPINIDQIVFKTVKKLLRKHLLKTGQRIDGRKYNKVRPLYTNIKIFDRIHGTGLFQRWETQVLSITTLWAPWKKLIKDNLEQNEEKERFMHHYYMPWYSTNEARAYRWQWRREIWHGFLAEKTLRPILPDEKDFPYTIRVASEVLSSNGSTSMASVCASCLSLMDAWVPIKKMVSWIAMGLVIQKLSDKELKEYKKNKDLKLVEINNKKYGYIMLTDLQGQEDFTWDMDFKVTWSKDGINALQLDMKVKWLPTFVLKQAIEQANIAREEILAFMQQTIKTPREKVSPYAPKITTLKLTQDNVRTIIWKWWETIKKLIEQTNVAIDFEDDGTTVITSENTKNEQKAIKMIEELIWKPTIWEIINWKINRIENYGVFVDLWKWKTWLCHVRNLSTDFIEDITKIFKIWDEIKVKITNIKLDGKVEIKKV